MDALNILVDKILMAIDVKISKLGYDKTFKSVIWKINKNGSYVISYLGKEYTVQNTLNSELKLGQSVWVKIPCGVLKNMHICGIAKKENER